MSLKSVRAHLTICEELCAEFDQSMAFLAKECTTAQLAVTARERLITENVQTIKHLEGIVAQQQALILALKTAPPTPRSRAPKAKP